MPFSILALTALGAAYPGDGLFQQGVPLDGQSFLAYRTEAGDLNGDGLEDLVLINRRPIRTSVALADGAGSFLPPRFELLLPGTESPSIHDFAVVSKLGDLNGDGHLDLFFATTKLQGYESKLWSALGDGLGGFAPLTLHWRMISDVGDLDLADVNSDGFIDVVVAGLDLGFVYVPGTAGGLANLAIPLLATGGSGKAVSAGDFDGDGFIDLAAGLREGPNATRVRVYYGDGTGQYRVQNSSYLADVVEAPPSIDSGDLDGDGALDVVTVDRRGARMRVWGNNSDRTFTEAYTLGQTFDLGLGIEIRDFDSDGAPDIFRITSNYRRVSTLRNLGAFSFSARTSAYGTTSLSFAGLVDIDQDGVVDAVARPNSGGLTSMLGSTDASGSYGLAPQGPLIGELYTSPSDIVAFDANGDGLDDLADERLGQLRVKLATGGGEYTAARIVAPDGYVADALTAGDVTGDGVADLVAYSEMRARFEVAAGDGQGNFAAAVPLFPFELPVVNVALQDLDGDGFNDLLWDRKFEVSSAFYAFGGPGGFSEPRVVALPLVPIRRRDTGDFNGDGLTDLLVTYFGEIAVSTQTTTQEFSSPVKLYGELRDLKYGASAVDLDGDGAVDVTFWSDAAQVSWLRNSGGGQFDPATQLVDALPISAIESDDFDLDGDQDLAWIESMASSNQGPAVWAENLGAGNFSDPVLVDPNSMVDERREILLLDADGDGDTDVFSTVTSVISGTTVVALMYSANTAIANLGENVCRPVAANSTGIPGGLTLRGSLVIADNSLQLAAFNLPVGAAGFFLASPAAGMTQNIPGSIGTLCLSGGIGRFVGPGEIAQADASGEFTLDLDLQAIPTPSMGRVPVVPGDTWVFQAWHRDAAVGGGATSNFTQAVRVEF